MHWKALDLDPAQATAKDVKRSYARLLKQCRPDQNPEGFKQLHEAYQTALAELEWRSGSSATPDSTPTSTTQDHERSEPTRDDLAERSEAVSHVGISAGAKSILRTLDQLEDALKNNLPDVAERVRASEAALFENPDEAPRWGDVMYRLIKIFADHPDLRLKPEAMLFELEHHSVAATVGVIDRLDQKENREAISNLARLVLTNKDRIRTPAGGIAASRLACAAAFLAKAQVGPLSDFAYETLARGERDFHMQLIDRHVSISSLLEDVPISIRNFWRQCLINGASNEAWDHDEGSAALEWLGSSQGRRNKAFEVLLGLLPEEVAASLPSRKPMPTQPAIPDEVPETMGGGKGHTFSWEADSSGSQQHQPVRVQKRTVVSSRSGFSLLWLFTLPFFLLLRHCFDDEPAATVTPLIEPRPVRVEDFKPTYTDSTKHDRSDSVSSSNLENIRKRKEKEFTTPGSTKGLDPRSNPMLKLLEEGASGAK